MTEERGAPDAAEGALQPRPEPTPAHAHTAGPPPEAAVPAVCSRCTGGGWVATAEECPECLGQPYANLDGIMLVCKYCHGTGRRNIPCPECGGAPG